jgi:hypothetical protein
MDREPSATTNGLIGKFRTWMATGWRALLLLLPAGLVVALALFFFAIFAAIFAVGAAAIGARFWWLRRKLAKSGGATTAIEGDYLVIERRQEKIDNRENDD